MNKTTEEALRALNADLTARVREQGRTIRALRARVAEMEMARVEPAKPAQVESPSGLPATSLRAVHINLDVDG